ncbi:diaminopimelate epimerase [Salmonella enterica subsp. enterica]|nr:diaminopimelate epimerase [Salmonella enterica subsp. enterica serovar Mikawasima]EDN7229170.1 diaminopimelate epimerase [Salmonella enterica subsp. enterica serovar Mikawasima]
MDDINELVFTKMHGAGNDFIIIDLARYPPPTPNMCKALSNRHTGVGCDMILGVYSSARPSASIAFRIWCSDGRESSQCGNGARCVASWALKEGIVSGSHFFIESPSGLHSVEVLHHGHLKISMGIPKFNPSDIPLHGLSEEQNVYKFELNDQTTITCGVISIGNPHAVILVDDITTVNVETLGKSLQQFEVFPPDINIGFAEIVSRNHIKLRVYEFGAGETLACGSGACAAVAVLVKQDLLERSAEVTLSGGDLFVHWDCHSSELFLTGPVNYSFKGMIPYASLQ